MLILSSFGFRYTGMRLKIGEVIKDQSGRMLIIPLASMFGTQTGEKEKNCAILLDFRKENIYVFDDSKPEELLGMQFDYIAVLGGNTFQLLYYVKKYGLDIFIKDQVANGAIYLGFSAGAYLACPDIQYVTLLEDNNHIMDGDFSALGLTDKFVLCHYDYRGMEYLKMCRDYLGKDAEIITIDDDGMVVL